ncbi:MAG TPA: hypothetical protein VF796_18640 [Humisphaera sp.]
MTAMKLWRHVIINTYCSWLHGDEQGFRSRGHRIHSSGDYKNPPPSDEHERLRWKKACEAGEAVAFQMPHRVVAVRSFVLKLQSLDHRTIACSCGESHLHALVELPGSPADVRREVGKAKQRVSHALRDESPGTVWSARGEYRIVSDRDHLQNAYDYIRTKQEPGTIVWSHAAEEDWIRSPDVGVLVISASRTLVRLPSADDPSAHAGV